MAGTGSLDYLVGEGQNAAFDKKTVKRLEDIASFSDEDKNHILYTLDALIKNVKLKSL
ncbi:DNA-binding protein [Reichenbachiella ulvae]|uniref:DNA-binding protein n=1 Tax=Reichenbachiella ulvae TaxID=2980104 RepID=A0ABT3CV95_9BACT|nr:DNA-binding protein [Reichenbachiella ulvae]MCV9387473.1 DNA-binding protein [Reichenbachiella ulvae]